ncbi:MAG: M23 family metallopeptidase [Dehalococcoidia bacterium]
MLAAMLVGTLVTVAFGDDDDSLPEPGVVVDWIVDEDAGATAAPTRAPRATSTPSAVTVSGFSYPVEGGCLPDDDNLMPGAPREYRDGIHEGMDFYDSDNCAFVGLDSEVLAAKDGAVIRADHTYEDLTADDLLELDALVAVRGGFDPEVEDIYRGRQVWIDHGDGIVTRYAHLNGIAEDIVVGSLVQTGDVIAYVGDSGTPESVTAPDTEVHLHFEIRIGEGYLGEGRPPDAVRTLYEEAFQP